MSELSRDVTMRNDDLKFKTHYTLNQKTMSIAMGVCSRCAMLSSRTSGRKHDSVFDAHKKSAVLFNKKIFFCGDFFFLKRSRS